MKKPVPAPRKKKAGVDHEEKPDGKVTVKGVKRKPRVKKTEEENHEAKMANIRKHLTPAEQLVWDKCIEALNSTKAISSWDKMAERILDLSSKVQLQDTEYAVDINWDIVATSNAKQSS